MGKSFNHINGVIVHFFSSLTHGQLFHNLSVLGVYLAVLSNFVWSDRAPEFG